MANNLNPIPSDVIAATRLRMARLEYIGVKFVSTGSRLLVSTPAAWTDESIHEWARDHKREILLVLLERDMKIAQSIGADVSRLYHVRDAHHRGVI